MHTRIEGECEGKCEEEELDGEEGWRRRSQLLSYSSMIYGF